MRDGWLPDGMLSIFISPKHFGTQAEFERMGLAYAAWVPATRRAERLADGVPLPPDTWANILQTAKRLGVNSSV